ncbi:lysophospholipid acyltransferase family protein [Meiothermus granaticius]|uniref:1-acyl-sn-glycerol-3-phosphate acyltransferase n=1 Tax=Meiothermus granaticius NBRC 107808 TaxID=1227551 RepID=A0A399FAY1_9DEIN|nr:lysophospholipid acyltransferase family protein [Meiothermus granaticius]MCL6527142.1 1-acyl-sn-glycerol-3-phosphate acyltransferase [Thermaceae bacterium]RIH93368.1 1-acyl-sn-glycerol-3-phosphate acyltransferase [Meiothermus granaticius NBRC 107808]GEM87617.1 1-acyl-sn-glycerol-3-phosphate acyltransferase [Meiothermus granaticius NBRC 107808]
MNAVSVYGVCKKLAFLLLKGLFGFKVVGAEKVPLQGPVMLASNHLSFIDPVAVGAACPRPVSFIARADVFKYPVLSWLLPRVHAIPVERGTSDLGAIKAAIRALQNGMAFGIFPEGRRSRTGVLEPFKTGAAAIALRTGATVVPVATIGTREAWPVGHSPRFFRSVTVVFGDPIPVPSGKADHQALNELTARIEAAVIALLPPEYTAKPTDKGFGSEHNGG